MQESLRQLQDLRRSVEEELLPVTYPIDLLLTGKMGPLTKEQDQALKTIQAALGTDPATVTVAIRPLEVGKQTKTE